MTWGEPPYHAVFVVQCFLTQCPCLQEYKDKVPQAVVDAVNAEIANVRAVMDSGKADEIREKVSALQQALMKIGESMSKPGDSPPQGGAAGEQPGEEEEKKESKGQ